MEQNISFLYIVFIDERNNFKFTSILKLSLYKNIKYNMAILFINTFQFRSLITEVV